MKRNDSLPSAPARASLRGPLAFGGHHVAVCSVAVIGAGVALSACAFELPTPGTDNLIEMQLTPAGEFRPSDGRPMKVKAWRIDAAIAAKAIERFNARTNDRVVDYDHQTLRAEDNGQPAPAAGYMKSLVWREGRGLFAVVEMTARLKQYIADREMKYVSPVFAYDKSGAVLDVLMAAVTNNPAIDGMEPLALRAAASYGLTLDHEEDPMKKNLLATAIALCAIATTATEEDAVAALNALQPKLKGFDDLALSLGLKADAKPEAVIAACNARVNDVKNMREALGIAADVSSESLVTACTHIRNGGTGNADPDPAKFVSVEVVEALKRDLATLNAKQLNGEVAELVESGLADGRLLPAQKDWATELGRKDITALTGYLATAQPIAALRESQTRGRSPIAEGEGAHGLSADELAVCSATGISPEDFAKSKKS